MCVHTFAETYNVYPYKNGDAEKSVYDKVQYLLLNMHYSNNAWWN